MAVRAGRAPAMRGTSAATTSYAQYRSVGHNLPQEAPAEFARAVLSLL
jgi:pimeloyl-ACP methyl ester carboxylesterase